jgi:YVTN family beta-propeller protein
VAPVLNADGRTLYVCNRFNNEVAIIDLQAKKMVRQIPVSREPVSAVLTKDGKFLLVANHLHAGRADGETVSAVVSVIDLAAGKVSKELTLPNGSGLLRDIRVSPDGKYAAVAHTLARFHLPTTQLERGWMNTSALTLIDLAAMKPINTVLVDNVDSGGANPWGVAWSADGKYLCVTHAGTYELSVIDAPALLAKLAKMPEKEQPGQKIDYASASRIAADVPNDLAFLVNIRQRLKLPGRGQRALALLGNRAWVVNYFNDSVTTVEFAAEYPKPVEIALGATKPMTVVRKGEMLFNDATICFQGWQSCASCHSSDARVDALNWDLLNDGIGNPKNNKSLLLSHRTPPAMGVGVRDTAEAAVRAGIRHILFTVQPEEVPAAIDEYLKSLRPIPGPLLEKGKLSPAATRGKKLFQSDAVGCADCHPSGLFTDLKSHDVGTRGQYDRPTDKFDTPTLIEVWRTAPYLHDGSAVTVRGVLTSGNRENRHGKTAHLTPQQVDDLVAYVLSL